MAKETREYNSPQYLSRTVHIWKSLAHLFSCKMTWSAFLSRKVQVCTYMSLSWKLPKWIENYTMTWFCVTAQIEGRNERKTQSLGSKCQFFQILYTQSAKSLEENKAHVLYINTLVSKAMNTQHFNVSKACPNFGNGMYTQLHATRNSI